MKMNYRKMLSGFTACLLLMPLAGCGSAPDKEMTALPEERNFMYMNDSDNSKNVTGAQQGADNYNYAEVVAEEDYVQNEYGFAEMEQAGQMNEGAAMDDGKTEYSPDEYNTEEYNLIEENGYVSVQTSPLSTFSADVDTASYANIRRMIYSGEKIDPGAVRLEEMINYFDYNYSDPGEGEPFAVHTELSDCPWNDKTQLFMVGINTKSADSLLEDRPPMNLVFLIDVSGSMYSEDKLPLVQKSFSMLTENLTPQDRISIVTYAGSDEVLLEGADGGDSERILDIINSLEAGGSTAGAAGITTAYDIAGKYFIEGGNNRIILATDGDLNVGISSESELTELVEEKREKGIFLSVLGFGTGNYKDNKLEAIADNGNGNYSYIDSEREARKVLVDEMSGTLFTAAKDVKFQVEFNPANVKGYRLIGYENRVMPDEDFNDDTKDAGEIGAGHSVTALYEIVPAGSDFEVGGSTLKYGSDGTAAENTENSDELLTVSIRYKEPDGDTSKLLEYPVSKSLYSERASENLTFAGCVAEFGMLLRNSRYIGDITYSNIATQLSEYDYSSDEFKDEFLYLVNTMKRR